MDVFEGYMQPILLKEGLGTLTDNPDDKGGVTIWGITEARARAAGFTGPMAGMTQTAALAIYRLYYWQQPGFDRIAGVFADLACYMLDVGINCGPHVPSAFLQRALNALSQNGKLYAPLTVDGQCGAMTRAALTAYLRARMNQNGETVLLQLVKSLMAVHYLEIAEADPSQQANEFGWLSHRAFG